MVIILMNLLFRGDWLFKNNLYDSKTHRINKNKLKQGTTKTLINEGFNLPLGEDERDVVYLVSYPSGNNRTS
jgi:hypothetical protein